MRPTHRFSISWARILSQGTGEENPAGIQYYKNLLSALKSRGVTPAVTLYHWDLPQALEDLGGWLNADVALWFEEYARVCFREFGEDVRLGCNWTPKRHKKLKFEAPYFTRQSFS